MSSQPNRVLPVLYSAMTMTILSVFPLINFINLFCCAGIIIGGLTGAYFYSKQLQGTGIPFTTRDAGMTGLLGGILAAVLVSGFGVLAGLLSHINPMNEMVNMFEQSGVSFPPEMLTYVEQFSAEYAEYGFSPTVAIVSLVMNLILFPLFGALGGIIGASIIGRKKSAPPA